MALPAGPAPFPAHPPDRRSLWKVVPYVITALLIVGVGVVFWNRNMDVGVILVVIGVVVILNFVVNEMRHSWSEDTTVDIE